MTPSEKAALERTAHAAGLTTSDLVRGSIDGFNPDAAEDLQALEDLSAELQRSNDAAARALDEALAELTDVIGALQARRASHP